MALFHTDSVGFGQRLDLLILEVFSNLFQPGNEREYAEEFWLGLVCREKDAEGIWDPSRIPDRDLLLWDLLLCHPEIPTTPPVDAPSGISPGSSSWMWERRGNGIEESGNMGKCQENGMSRMLFPSHASGKAAIPAGSLNSQESPDHLQGSGKKKDLPLPENPAGIPSLRR